MEYGDKRERPPVQRICFSWWWDKLLKGVGVPIWMPGKFTACLNVSEASTSHFWTAGFRLKMGFPGFKMLKDQNFTTRDKRPVWLEGWKDETWSPYGLLLQTLSNQRLVKVSTQIFSPDPPKSSDEPCNSCQQRVLWLSIPFETRKLFQIFSHVID